MTNQNQMPKKWKKVKLGDIADTIFSGGTPNTSNQEYWNGKYNWLSSGETNQKFIYDTKKKITKQAILESSTRLGEKGDIVIASAGQGNTRGQTSLLKIDTYINQSIICIRINSRLADNIWVFYNLRNRYSELRQISDSTSSRGSLTTKIIKDLEIVMPILDEQQSISKLLLTIDNKIELNNKMSKTLEEVAQLIFKNGKK